MRLNLEQHCFRVEVDPRHGKRTMHFTNPRVAVLTAIQETGTRDGFKVFDPRERRALTFDEVMAMEADRPENYWPERWKRRLDV